jgi:hypothetical protein
MNISRVKYLFFIVNLSNQFFKLTIILFFLLSYANH